MLEVWKEIKDFEGYYKASSKGNVKSILRKIIRIDGKSKIFKGKILSASHNKRGYYNIKLYKENKCTTKNLHRIIAETFILNPEKLPEVNHKDGNKANCCVDNLEWCTSKENREHAYNTGLYNQDGENNINAKLTQKEIFEIRKLNGKMTQVEIGKRFGVIQQTISLINNNKNWKHI